MDKSSTILLGLAKGRHQISFLADKEYIFSDPISDPSDYEWMESHAYEILEAYKKNGLDKLELVVTGLTPACIAVVKACKKLDLHLDLWHFNQARAASLADKPVDPVAEVSLETHYKKQPMF